MSLLCILRHMMLDDWFTIFISILFMHCLELVALKASFGNSVFKGAMYGKTYDHSEILHGR